MGLDRELAEQRAFYRADAMRSDEWLTALVYEENDEADAQTYRAGRRRIARHLSSMGSLGRVLEVAAGTGRFAELYLPLADSATLVDPSPENLAIADARLGATASTELELIDADIFHWDPAGRTFDTICFSAWLHHVPRDRFDRFWEAVEALLAPDGAVIFDFLDARVPAPGPVVLPDVPTEGYTSYAPADGVSVRDHHGRRWHVVHELWHPDDLARRLSRRGWQVTVLGPGLLSTMLWATAHRRRRHDAPNT